MTIFWAAGRKSGWLAHFNTNLEVFNIIVEVSGAVDGWGGRRGCNTSAADRAGRRKRRRGRGAPGPDTEAAEARPSSTNRASSDLDDGEKSPADASQTRPQENLLSGISRAAARLAGWLADIRRSVA